MIFVQICVGSSCFLKGSEEIVNRMTAAVERHQLEDEVILSGSFCSGKCNRNGVTIHVEDDTFTGITGEDFEKFFQEQILQRVRH